MSHVRDVALVDDDELYREVLSSDLADRGFVVSCFADGPSFLDALNGGIEPQLALLDWAMPKMSGLELLRAIRERGSELPVVFLTGHAMVERELQALNLGAIDFVDKTRGTDVLAHRMRVVIEGRRTIAGSGKPEAQRHGYLTLFPDTARALWRFQDVGLTVTEYKIVQLLVSQKGKPQTYRAIYDTVHYAGFVAGTGELGHHANVRSLVKRIRGKFLAIDPSFAEIENVEGAGYFWRDPTQEVAIIGVR
jgi:two-component system, OmpR family, response regulator ChvI